jgi:hypothetical protein
MRPVLDDEEYETLWRRRCACRESAEPGPPQGGVLVGVPLQAPPAKT